MFLKGGTNTEFAHHFEASALPSKYGKLGEDGLFLAFPDISFWLHPNGFLRNVRLYPMTFLYAPHRGWYKKDNPPDHMLDGMN